MDRWHSDLASARALATRLAHVPHSARALHALIDDVVDADWRDPSWWSMCAGVAILEAIGRDATHGDDELRDLPLRYLNSNGDPRADTFMGRSYPESSRPGDRVADAIACARAALEVIPALDREFPGQPLSCFLTRERGLLWPAPLGSNQRTVAFALPQEVFLARIPPDTDGADEDRSVTDASLARALTLALRGRSPGPALLPLAADSPVATRAALTVSLVPEPVGTARHLHRRAWTRGGGPWLGVGFTHDLQVTTTCHMIVDGFGHTRLTCELLRTYDRIITGVRARVASAHTSAPGDPTQLEWTDIGHRAQPHEDIWPLGIAMHQLHGRQPAFAALAYTLGCTLEQHIRAEMSTHERRRYRYTPAFQVPVAPGRRSDPAHWRHRVMPGLLSVRMHDGKFEPYSEFRSRIPTFLTRERQTQGLLARMRLMVARLPVPLMVKRRIMSSTKTPHAVFPQIAALAGRGCLSLLRFPPHEQPPMPIYGVSAPALDTSPHDARGSSVLTAISNPAGLALTLGGVGSTGPRTQTRAFLDHFLERLSEHVPDDHSP